MNLNDLFTEEKVRLDPKCWTGKKIGNPKTKMKGGTRVNNCVPAESVNEMDKSQTPPGRDGSNDSDTSKKEYTAKPTTAKKVAKDGEKILNKELNKKQGVAEGELGSVVGGALGAIAGSRLGPVGTAVGAHYGAKAGNSVTGDDNESMSEAGVGGTAEWGGGLYDKRNQQAKNPEIENDLKKFRAWLTGGARVDGIVLQGVETYFKQIEPIDDGLAAEMMTSMISSTGSDPTYKPTPQMVQKVLPYVDEAIKAPMNPGLIKTNDPSYLNQNGQYSPQQPRQPGQPGSSWGAQAAQQAAQQTAQGAQQAGQAQQAQQSQQTGQAGQPGYQGTQGNPGQPRKTYDTSNATDATIKTPGAVRPAAAKPGVPPRLPAPALRLREQGKGKSPEQPEADYGDDYQDMVARVKKLAGLGPLKTVYDPAKRVYRNIPTAVQPKK